MHDVDDDDDDEDCRTDFVLAEDFRQFCLVVATLETDPDGSRYCVATLCHRVLLHVGHVRTSPWACVSVTLQ